LAFLKEFNESPEIADLYQAWFEAWQAEGGTTFAHFSDYGAPSRFGSWGAMDYLGQDQEPGAQTPKIDFLDSLNDADPWWNEVRDPTAFLHGLRLTGTDGDDAIAGTPEEDVLIGAGGNDVLSGGGGGDILHGGSGADTLYGGAGDDALVIDGVSDKVDGGGGFDTLRLTADLAAIDFAALPAIAIEAIDTRNASATDIVIAAEDAFTFNDQRTAILWADSADTLTLSGLAFTSTLDHGRLIHDLYEGVVHNETVSLTIISDAGHSPDILLAA
jgi:Ca2+-binding RTX toxin-like protein